jgi:hypothetical protein
MRMPIQRDNVFFDNAYLYTEPPLWKDAHES